MEPEVQIPVNFLINVDCHFQQKSKLELFIGIENQKMNIKMTKFLRKVMNTYWRSTENPTLDC